MSNNSGVSWYKYDNISSSFINIAIPGDSESLANLGNTITEVENIPSNILSAFVLKSNTIRFGYILVQGEGSVCEVGEIQLYYCEAGTWREATDIEYSYEYYGNRLIKVKLYADGNYKINYYKSDTPVSLQGNNDTVNNTSCVWKEFKL